MGSHNSLLLNPEPVDIVLEAKSCWKEGWQAKGIVVTRNTTVHPPVHIRYGWPKVHQDVKVIQLVQADLVVVVQKHIHKVDRIDIVSPRTERLRYLDDCVLTNAPMLQDHGVVFDQSLGRVCF